MTDILGQLKWRWESLKKRRKDNRLILLYKGLKGKARIPTDRPAKSPDLGRRLSAFSLLCRLSGFEVHFTGEIENLLVFFSDRLFYYLR